jgi:predicted kinase
MSRYHAGDSLLPVSTLLHLNGPSGVGKSTLARAYADAHPGTLLCDIDELRSWVSGWADDFVGTGEAVRASALALITAYLSTGRDVVLPQLIVTPAQVDRFEQAAAEAGATYVGVMLAVEPDLLLERLHARAVTPVTAVVSRIIEERGGDALVLQGRQQLLDLAAERRWAVVDATDRGTALHGIAEAATG